MSLELQAHSEMKSKFSEYLLTLLEDIKNLNEQILTEIVKLQ
jgi:hypothetical protein